MTATLTETRELIPETAICRCRQAAAFCAIHGTFNPATEDLEVKSFVEVTTQRPSKTAGRRVIRKRGGLSW